MATLQVPIPPEFIKSMNDFMDSMKKFADTSKKAPRVAVMPPPLPRHRIPRSWGQDFYSSLNRWQRTLTRVESYLASDVDRLMREIGPSARSWMTRFDVIGLINRTPVSQATLAYLSRKTMLSASELVGLMNVPAYFIMKAIEFLLLKPFQLAPGVVADFMEAAGYRTTIGGLRAYRVAYGALPGSMQALSATAGGLTDIMSGTSMALAGLRIKQMLDGTQTVTKGLMALQVFMLTHPPTTTIPLLRAMGITYPTEFLLAIRNMSKQELEREGQNQERLRKKFELPPKVHEAFRGLRNALRLFTLNLNINFIKIMSEGHKGHPSLIEGLTDLSKGVAHFIDFLSKLIKAFVPMTKRILHKGLVLWAADRRKLIDAVSKFKDFLRSSLRQLAELLRRLTGITVPMKWYYPSRARFMARTQVQGAVRVFRPGIRHPGAWRGPGAAPSRAQVFRPGIRRPGAVTRPSQVPSRAYEPPPLKVPGAPSEAAETTREAVERGYRQGSGTGLFDRSGFQKELADNPALRQKVAAIALAEAGNNPEAQQAVIESMMNRARVRGQKLEQTARWTDEPGGYYSADGRRRGEGMASTGQRSGADASINRVLGGSRVIGTATDNSSNIPG